MTPLLELTHITKNFSRPLDLAAKIARLAGANVHEIVVHALDDVSLTINEGEVVGLAGESGCGKSTLGRIAAGILTPTIGTRAWRGTDITVLAPEANRDAALKIQMVFQDAFASLNPRMRVAEIIGEAPRVHGIDTGDDIDYYVDQTMRKVGLDPSFRRRFPHQFSGGQRARIGIARALAVKPELLVCDEAVAALDVSIQAQVLNLFLDLRRALNLTAIFISHDLGVVRHLSDRVAIMYLGRIVEIGPAAEIYASPKHPYTQALLASVPRLNRSHAGRSIFRPIAGELPSPLAPPPGCHFHPRCARADARCKVEAPVLRPMGDSRRAACHYAEAG